MIINFANDAVKRNPIDVHVENRHENADLAAFAFEIRSSVQLVQADDLAVGRCYDRCRQCGDGAVRIPEKIDDENRRHQPKQRQYDNFKQCEDGCSKCRCEYERVTGFGHRKSRLEKRPSDQNTQTGSAETSSTYTNQG